MRNRFILKTAVGVSEIWKFGLGSSMLEILLLKYWLKYHLEPLGVRFPQPSCLLFVRNYWMVIFRKISCLCGNKEKRTLESSYADYFKYLRNLHTSNSIRQPCPSLIRKVVVFCEMFSVCTGIEKTYLKYNFATFLIWMFNLGEISFGRTTKRIIEQVES